jgi:undecaprenyl-diphosphatase
MNPAVLSSDTSIVVTFLASFLIWVMFAGLVLMWFIDGRVKREQALHAIFASIIAWSLSLMIKHLLPMSRPFVIDGTLPLTLTLPSANSSFPSTHASVAFALAVSVWIHNKKIGNRFLIMAILVGFGRIASNVHTTLDVFAGIILGITTAFMLKKLHTYKLLD